MAQKIINSLTDPKRTNSEDISVIMGGVVVVLCLLWTIS